MLTAVLECGGNREAECLARFAQSVAGPERVDRLLEGKVASGLVYATRIARHRAGKHVTRDGHGRIGGAVETERVVGPIDTERGINDRQHDLKFDSGGHARHPVGSWNGLKELREWNLLSAHAL